MNKHAKGALAAGTAAVLLLGGAGSLAYWSDNATASSEKITSGQLGLSGDDSTKGWVYADDNANAGQPVNEIVPGDKITTTHDFKITAKGDNITATLATPDEVTVNTDGTNMDLNVDATYTIDGDAAPGTITEAQDGKTLHAAITVDFPYGDTTVSNDTQDVTATLDDLTVSLTQADPNAGA